MSPHSVSAPGRGETGDVSARAASHGERRSQERAIRTRDTVLRAAATVFDRLGYAAATVDQIAAEAEATKGAVYFHFESKAALAFAVVAQQHAAWGDLALAAESWELPAVDKLERLIREVARTYATNPLMRAGVRLANEQDHIDVELPVPFVGWTQRVTRLLRAGQADGSIRRDLNCAAAARSLVASFYGIEEVSARLDDRRDLDRRAREWWGLMRLALTPQVKS